MSKPLKIALLAGGSSIHTIRWANGLAGAGIKVHLITQHRMLEPVNGGVQVHEFPYRGVAGYFTMVPGVRRLLRAIKPDLVNAHYASGYATTARLAAGRPWLLSVWGSDVYDFPFKSPLHRWWAAGNLRAADAVASTSHCMAEQTRSLAPTLGEIPITPFGVDCEAFSPAGAQPDAAVERLLVIGTVKTLAPKYGIDVLIRAFALLQDQLSNGGAASVGGVRLRIVGDGPERASLQTLAGALGVSSNVDFVGRVEHSQVPDELRRMDVFAAMSRLDSESFGVAAIEAGAAGLPVVVSDAGGLPEVVLDGRTGLVVPKENAEAAAQALYRLVIYADLRRRLGRAGREHVMTHYAWDACVNNMVNVYEKVIRRYRGSIGVERR